jgi:hypothetical protein
LTPRLAWLLLLLILAAWPQQAEAQARSAKTLAELKARRDQARDRHHDVGVQASVARQALSRQRAQLARLTDRVRELQRQPAGVIRDRQLQSVRREQNQVSRQLANLTLRLRALEDAQRVRRLELVQASWAWVARLLETADRAWRIGRKKQAQEQTDQALLELERLEALEALLDATPEPFEVPPVDPAAPDSELRELRELYVALEESFEEQAQALRPSEARLKSRVMHLDRLVRYAYSVPTLGERLKRARRDLERVSGLRRAASDRARRCRKEIETIDRVFSQRGLEPADGE